MENKYFYITTTLPYVNAELHMGHALEFIRADAIARHRKSLGYDVFFNTGTDEHGLKMYEKAQDAGKTAQDFVDEYFQKFKNSVAMFGMIQDLHFIRTTDPHHIASAQEFWRRCDRAGFIYKANYQAKYCVGCESEKTDSDLIDDMCPDHPNKKIEHIDEENYFFKYSAFEKKLLDFYENRKDFVVPETRFNEVKNFVKNGLKDFSISRQKSKMPWGIEVPGDPDHVMYVWFDALTNYINTLGWPDEEGDFKKYWIDGFPTQYCGKDNTRFQAAMWQAMLMAADVPNSHQVIVNGFVTGEGGVKMSKTLGNVVNPKELAEEYSTDALRYFVLRELSPFEDSPFTMERFKEAYNANLANGIGNLTSRIMRMASTSLEEVPTLHEDAISQDFNQAMLEFNIGKACDIIFDRIAEIDSIIQREEPYKVIKQDKEAGVTIIQTLVAHLYIIADMLEAIMPETSAKIKSLIKENKMPDTPLFARKD